MQCKKTPASATPNRRQRRRGRSVLANALMLGAKDFVCWCGSLARLMEQSFSMWVVINCRTRQQLGERLAAVLDVEKMECHALARRGWLVRVLCCPDAGPTTSTTKRVDHYAGSQVLIAQRFPVLLGEQHRRQAIRHGLLPLVGGAPVLLSV